jgi:cation:H+ antiporter
VIAAFGLLLLSFAALLAGAYVFTNAVEWAGVRLNLGHGAVGSVLAAVATALPESLIPVVAIISGEQTGEVAIGAIIGAPFLLGTLAMAIVGILAPLASELPEKLNSVLWVRQAKDTLALGNITGAMVYQSMLPVAVGLAFTPWSLTGPAVAASAAALAGGALAVAVVLRGGRVRLPYVGTWLLLYAGAVVFILADR